MWFKRKPPEQPMASAQEQDGRIFSHFYRDINAFSDRLLVIDDIFRELNFKDETAGNSSDGSESAVLNNDIKEMLHRSMRSVASILHHYYDQYDRIRKIEGFSPVMQEGESRVVIGDTTMGGHMGDFDHLIDTAAERDMTPTEKKRRAKRVLKYRQKRRHDNLRNAGKVNETLRRHFPEEEFNNFSQSLSELEMAVTAAIKVQKILIARDGENVKFTPIQITRAKKCLLELERFAHDCNSSKRDHKFRNRDLASNLGESLKRLEEVLDIKKRVADVITRVENLILELEHEMAEARAKYKGTISLADKAGELFSTERAEEVRSLLQQIAEVGLEAEAEFKGVNERVAQVAKRFKSAIDQRQDAENSGEHDGSLIDWEEIEGQVVLLGNGDLKEIYLVEFDKKIGLLNSLIVKLNRLLNIKERAKEIEAPALVEQLPAETVAETSDPDNEGRAADFKNLNEDEARHFGLERVEVAGNHAAQVLIDKVIKKKIDITTEDGQTEFVSGWQANCPHIAMPCVPDTKNYFYLTDLQKGLIVSNLEGKHKVVKPNFADSEILWIDGWKEAYYDSPDKILQGDISPLLKELTGRIGVVDISGKELDEALWEGDPVLRKPSPKHQIILERLGLDRDKYEIRRIRQDEYARLHESRDFGHKILWTSFDHYELDDNDIRYGLSGGQHNLGGASYVMCEQRLNPRNYLAIRLVVARK